MSINVTVNGNKCEECFLIAPDQNRTFPARLGLSTDDGSTVDATLNVLPGGATIELEKTQVTIGPVEMFVNLHATSQSSTRGDTVVQVLVDDVEQSRCPLTAITNLKVWFKGRFQARFATDGDFYNERRGRGGWTFALEGEPDFVPADSLVDRIDKPVGREIRFHNPVALRPHVLPIGVTVISITGKLATGSDEEFAGGDPVLGQPVDLGPNSYFAGNSPPPQGTSPAEGPYGAGLEPIALFEFHVGNQFSGKSLSPEDRPITDPALGLEFLTREQLTRFGIDFLEDFNLNRLRVLLDAHDAMSPADRTGTIEGRNLRARIRRMFLSIPQAWFGREWFTGLINDNLQIDPQDSAVLTFLQGFNSFWFSTAFFNYHADELCGQVLGYISSADDEVVDPFEPNAALAPAVALEVAPPQSRTVDRNDREAQLPPDLQD